MEAALITGSRGWTDADSVMRVVRAYEFVVVGCARRGVDRMVRDTAEATGAMLRVFRADWDAEPTRGGILRNLVMVTFCCALELDDILVHCHAFWDGKSPGTRHCGLAAEAAGFPTTWHTAR